MLLPALSPTSRTILASASYPDSPWRKRPEPKRPRHNPLSGTADPEHLRLPLPERPTAMLLCHYYSERSGPYDQPGVEKSTRHVMVQCSMKRVYTPRAELAVYGIAAAY